MLTGNGVIKMDQAVKEELSVKLAMMGKFHINNRKILIKKFTSIERFYVRWVRVEWDSGTTNSYRMGKEGQYDLRLADCASSIISPDTETEEDTSLTEIQLTGCSHPTKLLKNASMKMLKIIAVSIALYGDQIEKNALANVCSMFRTLLASKPGVTNLGLEYWTTLGFLRAIAQPKQMSKLLTTPTWLKLCVDILNSNKTKLPQNCLPNH